MAAATSFVEGEGIASGGSGGVASGPRSPLRRSLTTCHGLGAGGQRGVCLRPMDDNR
jgi:hypothetical protein